MSHKYYQEGYDQGYNDAINDDPPRTSSEPDFIDVIFYAIDELGTGELEDWEEGYRDGYRDGEEDRERKGS